MTHESLEGKIPETSYLTLKRQFSAIVDAASNALAMSQVSNAIKYQTPWFIVEPVLAKLWRYE